MKSNKKIVLAHFDHSIEADFMVSFLESFGIQAWSVGDIVNTPGYSDPRVLIFETDRKRATELVSSQYPSGHRFEIDEQDGKDWNDPDSFDSSREMPESEVEKSLKGLGYRHIVIFLAVLMLGMFALAKFDEFFGPG